MKMDLFEKKGIMFLIAFTLLSSCGKDPDPCAGAKEIKAGFHYNNVPSRLEDWMKPYWIRYDWTTCYTGGATWEIDSGLVYDSLEWHIGSEVIKNQTSVYRTNFPDNSDIPITLIVWGKPNKQCFPNDNGIDTLTKVYHFTSKKDRLIGTFREAFTDVLGRSDTFEFTISYDPRSSYRRYIDTFPFTACRNYIFIPDNFINEDFGYGFENMGCPNPDTTRAIGTFYIRFLDNNTNRMEVILNAQNASLLNSKAPVMHWRGFKKQ